MLPKSGGIFVERMGYHGAAMAARSMALAKREAVLSIALLLAVVSACFVPPCAAYFGYIDWNTLALLFSLMVVMKGYQRAGVFLCLANGLLRRVRSTRACWGCWCSSPLD